MHAREPSRRGQPLVWCGIHDLSTINQSCNRGQPLVCHVERTWSTITNYETDPPERQAAEASRCVIWGTWSTMTTLCNRSNWNEVYREARPDASVTYIHIYVFYYGQQNILRGWRRGPCVFFILIYSITPVLTLWGYFARQIKSQRYMHYWKIIPISALYDTILNLKWGWVQYRGLEQLTTSQIPDYVLYLIHNSNQICCTCLQYLASKDFFSSMLQLFQHLQETSQMSLQTNFWLFNTKIALQQTSYIIDSRISILYIISRFQYKTSNVYTQKLNKVLH